MPRILNTRYLKKAPKHNVILQTVSLLYCSLPSECGTYDQAKAVNDELFRNYSNELRPVLDQNNPVVVNLSMIMSAINDFDEVKGVITLSIALVTTWKDENLVWDPTSTNVSSLVVSQQKLWLPRLYLMNPADEVEPIHHKYFKAEIQNNGYVSWTPSALIKATCSPDVTKYPYDSQTCTLILVSVGYRSEHVSLNSVLNSIQIVTYTENSEWSVDSTTAYSSIYNEQRADGLSIASFELVVVRRSLYMVVNVIVPIVLLVVVTPFVFLLPGNSGERASYSITVLLAFSVYMTVVHDKMPASSLPVSFLSYFLLSCLIVSVFVVGINVLQMRIYETGDEQLIPMWLYRLIRHLKRISNTKRGNRVSNVEPITQNDLKREMYVSNGSKLLRIESEGSIPNTKVVAESKSETIKKQTLILS